jgi:hypothetical protein
MRTTEGTSSSMPRGGWCKAVSAWICGCARAARAGSTGCRTAISLAHMNTWLLSHASGSRPRGAVSACGGRGLGTAGAAMWVGTAAPPSSTCRVRPAPAPHLCRLGLCPNLTRLM